jgi:hypothetical protein
MRARRGLLCLGFCGLLMATAAVGAQPVRLAPVDEAAGDATWTRFRARLIDALLRRDEKFVAGLLDPNVRNISGIRGAAEFVRLWELKSPQGRLWEELPKALYLGSVLNRQDRTTEVCAPYVYFRWPDNAPDEANAAVIAKEALLKARPSASAPTLQTLSFDLVAVSDWEVADEAKDAKQVWVAVRTRSGNGYLPEEQVRSPLEYRACFVKREGTWRLTGLEAGE